MTQLKRDDVPLVSATVVCLGNFDGVHIGHRAMMAHAVSVAQEQGLQSVVMSFRPFPWQHFGRGAGVLSRLSDQFRMVGALGVDMLYACRFCDELAALSPEDFVQRYLVDVLRAKCVIVGEDFCFGAKRSGTVDTLKALGVRFGFDVYVYPDVCKDGARVSSSRIRTLLGAGDVLPIRDLLSDFWRMRVRFVENDYCDLVADVSRYASIKNGGYWVKLEYAYNGAPMSVIVPVVLRDGMLALKPLESLPDIPEGMAFVSFIEPLVTS